MSFVDFDKNVAEIWKVCRQQRADREAATILRPARGSLIVSKSVPFQLASYLGGAADPQLCVW